MTVAPKGNALRRAAIAIRQPKTGNGRCIEFRRRALDQLGQLAQFLFGWDFFDVRRIRRGRRRRRASRRTLEVRKLGLIWGAGRGLLLRSNRASKGQRDGEDQMARHTSHYFGGLAASVSGRPRSSSAF